MDLFDCPLFDADEFVLSGFKRTNKLIELGLNGRAVAVLRVLNQKHHQKRNDRRGGADQSLPRIGEMKDGRRNRPGHYRGAGECEGKRMARHTGDTAGDQREPSRQKVWSALRLFAHVARRPMMMSPMPATNITMPAIVGTETRCSCWVVM